MALQTFNPTGMIAPRDTSLQNALGKELENSFNRVRNKYAETEAQARIGLHGAQSQEAQAKAQKAQQMAHILQAFSQAEGQPGMSPLLENLGISMMGGRPLSAYTNADNQHVQPSFFGKGTVLDQARSPEAIKGAESYASEMGKANVEAIKQNYGAYTQAINAKNGMQGMLKMLEDQELGKVVGPFWKDKAAKYLGSDRAKELQGTFNTLGKNIVTETAQAFGTRFTNQEMKWLQDILPSSSDTLPAIKGKVRTLEMLRQANEQKAVIKDQLMRQHQMDPITADQLADSQVNLDAIKRELKPTVSFKSESGEIFDIPKIDTALVEKLRKQGYQEGDF